MKIILTGDKEEAAKYVGWAKQKFKSLRRRLELSGLDSIRPPAYRFGDATIRLKSVFGKETARIEGIVAEGGVVYVPEWSYSSLNPLPRIQIFDISSNYLRESSDPNGLFTGEKYAYDVAYYKDYLYSTNWSGYVHVFTKEGVYLKGVGEQYNSETTYQIGQSVKYPDTSLYEIYQAKKETKGNLPTNTTYWEKVNNYLTNKVIYGEQYDSETTYLYGRRVTYPGIAFGPDPYEVYQAKKTTKGHLPTDTAYWELVNYPGAGSALEQIAIGGDKIAISANFKSNLKWVYFFDMNFNYLFDVNLLPVWTVGSQGVEIYGDKVFVAWSGEITTPQTSYYGIWEYNLADGVFTGAFYDDETLGEFAQSLSAYNGILYAADTRKDQIVKYDIATRTVIGKIDLTNIMLTDTKPRVPADISPRGLAVNSSGIWITCFKYDGSLHPELPVKLYHCDLGGSLIREIGIYGTGHSQFKTPFGVALREVA